MRFLHQSTSLPNSSSLAFLRGSAFSTELAHRSLGPEAALPTKHQIYGRLLEICLRKCERIRTRNSFDEMAQRIDEVLITGKTVHGQSLKLGFDPDGLLGKAIVDLYAKCGDVCLAEKAFDFLEKRDASAWNSILSMYSRLGSLERVLKTFRSMHNSRVFPNEFGFSLTLSACAKSVDVEFGRQVHCGVVKMGLQSSSFCEGALVDMYSKCNFISDARRVFDGVADHDTVSGTAMIAGYVQAGLPEEALKVFDKMKCFGHRLDQVAFVTAINACAGLGRLDDAREMFAQMANPNVVAWNVMISGHAKRGHEVEAIEIFKSMRRSGIKSTRSTLGSILSAIGNASALDLGLLVHGEATKQGLTSNVYVGSSLINMYGKCGKMDAASKVFLALEEKNVVLWNAVLGSYAQNGHAHKVMDLFFDMKCSGFEPDDFTFTSVFCACACLRYLETGSQLHAVAIKSKLASNLFVGNALMDMYAKSGATEQARKQFEHMSNQDNVSWNAIIVGYVQEENETEAFNLFRRMNLSGIVPDEACLASILSACANIRGLDLGKQIHVLSIKSGLETGVFSGSSLIDMYAKCGLIVDAQRVLAFMPNRSVVSMNALIAGYSQINLDKAIALFQEMLAEGLNPTEVTFASLLDACDGQHNLLLGPQIHSLVVKTGLLGDDEFLNVSLMGMHMSSCRMSEACTLFSEFSSPKSVVLWTAIISGHSQNNLNEEALHFYGEMRREGALPDQATFVSVLRACSVLSAVKEGKAIHSLIFSTNYDQDELTCSGLVDMYAKCGDVNCAAQVFDEMISRHHVISWNSMVVAFAKNGYAEDSLRIFNEMRQAHVTPDEVTFLGVLTACSHAGKVSEGRKIFDSMVNLYGIKPRADHCACMIDILGRWGYLEEAEKLIQKHNLDADTKVWASLLGACRLHGDDIRGCIAAEKLIELEPHNSSAYVLLSNIYASQGHWDKVNVLRRVMREKGVKKFPGCSWIDVGYKTHMFVAGDKSHPHGDDIDAMLMDLSETMKKDVSFHDIDSCFS